MDKLILVETADGFWGIYDEEYDEPIGDLYPTEAEAERARDNERQNRAERAHERQQEKFYG